jgi:hypothetical protein
VATFSNLSIDKTGTGYTLVASATSLAPATSGLFNITAGTANRLVFGQSPTTTAGGASMSPAVTVQIQDVNSNLTTSTATVALAIGTNPGGGTLSGTVSAAAVGGVATFSNLSINKMGTGYTLVASSAPLTSATSGTFNVTVGAASQFVVTPSTVTPVAGTSFTVTLAAADAGGNTVTSYAAGAHTVNWSGATTSPGGNVPTYPATSVSFTNGVSTTTLTTTLFAAGANSLMAGATIPTVTGTTTVTVSALAAAKLAWTHVVSAGTLSSPCAFTCTATAVGNFGLFTANVSVTDTYGNTVSNIGTGHTVTVTAASGGSFTAPTAGTSVTLTINGSGAADSTATFTFRAQNGSWTSNTFTASTLAGTAYANATASVTKQ